MNEVVLWIRSHRRPAVALIRQHQRTDNAVCKKTCMINHLTDVLLLCLCVCFAFSDQGCLFSVMFFFFFYLISRLCKLEPFRGQIIASRLPLRKRENQRRTKCEEREMERRQKKPSYNRKEKNKWINEHKEKSIFCNWKWWILKDIYTSGTDREQTESWRVNYTVTIVLPYVRLSVCFHWERMFKLV